MGIISRFADIMSANVNALLDKCEDPAKMVDQTLRKLEEQRDEVKSETAGVIANEKRCERVYNEAVRDASEWEQRARKALAAGNEADATKCLQEKQKAGTRAADALKSYQAAQGDSQRMRQMYDKLCSDINDLNSRKEAVKAKMAVAKATEKVNKAVAGVDTAGSMNAFARMEAKANERLDRACAEAEMNSPGASSVDDLASRYDSVSAVDVSDELARLKAEMGL